MTFLDQQDSSSKGPVKDDEMILKVDYHGKKCVIFYDDERKSLSFPTFVEQIALKFGIISTNVKQNSSDNTPDSSSKCAGITTVSSDQNSSDNKNKTCLKIFFTDTDGDQISVQSHEDMILAFRLAEKLPLNLLMTDTASLDEVSLPSKSAEKNGISGKEETGDYNESQVASPMSSDFEVIEKEEFHVDSFSTLPESNNKGDDDDDQIDDDENLEIVSSNKQQPENFEILENLETTVIEKDSIDPIDFFRFKMKESLDIQVTRLQIMKFLELSQLPSKRLLKFKKFDVKIFLSLKPKNCVHLIMYDAYEQLSLLVEKACNLNVFDNNNLEVMMTFETFRIICRSLGVWPKRFVKLQIVSSSILDNPPTFPCKLLENEGVLEEKHADDENSSVKPHDEKSESGEKQEQMDSIDIFIQKFQRKNGTIVTREQFSFLNDNFLKLPSKRMLNVNKIHLEKSESLRGNLYQENGFMILVEIHNQILAKGNENQTISLELFQLICRSLKVWPARFIKLNLVKSDSPYALALNTQSEKKRVGNEVKKLEKQLVKEQNKVKKEQRTAEKEAEKAQKQAKKLEKNRQKVLKKKQKVDGRNSLEACLDSFAEKKITITKAQLVFFSKALKFNYKRLNKFAENPKNKFGRQGQEMIDEAYMIIYSEASDKEMIDVETFSAILRNLGVSPRKFVNLNIIDSPANTENVSIADVIEKDIEKVVFSFANTIVKAISTAITPVLGDDSTTTKAKRKKIENKALKDFQLNIERDLNMC